MTGETGDPRLPAFSGAGGPRVARIDADAWAAAGFVTLIVLVILGPILSTLSGDLSGEGNPLRQVSYLLAFALLAAAGLRLATLTAAFTTSAPVNLLLSWCWASMAWAIAPGIGLRRLVLTCVIIYSVFIAVECLGRDRTRRYLITLLIVTFVLNLVAAVAVPGIGVHPAEAGRDAALVGNWRGIFPEKNLAGAVTAVTFLMVLFAREPGSRLLRFLLLAGLLFFLVRTESKTSMGIGALALIAGVLHRRYDPRLWPMAMLLAAALALGAALLVQINLARILALLDNQGFMTGRAQIWSSLLAYTGDNWPLGAGYGSFWNIGPGSPILSYARSDSWLTDLASGHNGYLDITAQIGVPGLILAVFALVVHPLGRLLTERKPTPDAPMLMAILVFCAGQNLTESTMLDRDHVIQFCLIWTLALIYHRPESGGATPHSTAKHSEAAKGAAGAGAQGTGSP